MNQPLEHLSDEELRDYFIRATDLLKSRGISHSKCAEEIGRRAARMDPRPGTIMDPKRMGNIRHGIINPKLYEVEILFDLYPDRLSSIREEIGRPSPLERRLTALENEINELKESDEVDRIAKEERIAMLKELHDLRIEVARYRKMINKGD